MAKSVLNVNDTRKVSLAHQELFSDRGLSVYALKSGRFEIKCGNTQTYAHSLQEVSDKISALDLHEYPGSGEEVVSGIQKKLGSQYRLEIKAAKLLEDGEETVFAAEGSQKYIHDKMAGTTSLNIAGMTPGKRYAMQDNMYGGEYAVLVPMDALVMELSPSFDDPQYYEKQPLAKGMVMHGIDPASQDIITVVVDSAYPNGTFKDNTGKVWSTDAIELYQISVGDPTPIEEDHNEPDMSMYESEDIPSYNPTGDVADMAPNLYDLNNYDNIMTASAGVLYDFMQTAKKVAYIDKSSLNKVHVSAVNNDNQATDGSIEWNVRIGSPAYKRSSQITIPMVMKEGSIDIGAEFITSTGQKFPMTVEAIKEHLGCLVDDPFCAPDKEVQSRHASTIHADTDIDHIADGVNREAIKVGGVEKKAFDFTSNQDVVVGDEVQSGHHTKGKVVEISRVQDVYSDEETFNHYQEMYGNKGLSWEGNEIMTVHIEDFMGEPDEPPVTVEKFIYEIEKAASTKKAGWSVNVGNIGNIDEDTEEAARATFKEYVEQSKSGVGRAGGESVYLLQDGEPVEEYIGPQAELEASKKTAASEKYKEATPEIKERLEALRKALEAENISYGELSELQSLTEYIAPDDVVLLEAAGVPEDEYRRNLGASKKTAAELKKKEAALERKADTTRPWESEANFVDYFMEFYDPEYGLYPIENLTKHDVYKAIEKYKQDKPDVEWAGDSVDREFVRDVLLDQLGFKIDYGTGVSASKKTAQDTKPSTIVDQFMEWKGDRGVSSIAVEEYSDKYKITDENQTKLLDALRAKGYDVKKKEEKTQSVEKQADEDMPEIYVGDTVEVLNEAGEVVDSGEVTEMENPGEEGYLISEEVYMINGKSYDWVDNTFRKVSAKESEAAVEKQADVRPEAAPEAGTYTADAEDLILIIDNDQPLYRQMVEMYKNLSKKKQKGTYDPELAPKMFKYVVDPAAKQWYEATKQWADVPGDVVNKVTPDVRREAAVQMARRFEEAYELKEYDFMKESSVEKTSAETWWELGVDEGEKLGTHTLEVFETKEEAEKALKEHQAKNPEDKVFIDEWSMDETGVPMPTEASVEKTAEEFKGGFEGCVKHFMNKADFKPKDAGDTKKEAAEKLCAYIKREKYGSLSELQAAIDIYCKDNGISYPQFAPVPKCMAGLVEKTATAWDVFLNDEEIDTVFDDEEDPEEVKRSLVEHDGYDPNITVERASETETGGEGSDKHPKNLAESYINGNISDVKEKLGGDTTLMAQVMMVLKEQYGPQEVADFMQLMARGSKKTAVRPGGEDPAKAPILSWDESQLVDDEVQYIMENPEEFEWAVEDIEVLGPDNNPITLELNPEAFKEGLKEHEDEIRDKVYADPSSGEIWWEDFTEVFNELIKEKGTEPYLWDISGRQLGWQNRSGSKTAQIENWSDFQEKVMPKTQDFTLYAYEGAEGGISFRVSHHDSPTGEFYEMTPVDLPEEGTKVTTPKGSGEVIQTDISDDEVYIAVEYDSGEIEYDLRLEDLKMGAEASKKTAAELPEGAAGMAVVREDIRGEEAPPVGEGFYYGDDPIPYRWINEDTEDEAFEIFLDDKWQEAMSIDWDFPGELEASKKAVSTKRPKLSGKKTAHHKVLCTACDVVMKKSDLNVHGECPKCGATQGSMIPVDDASKKAQKNPVSACRVKQESDRPFAEAAETK